MVNSWTVLSSTSLLVKHEMLIFLNSFIISKKNTHFSFLFLIIVLLMIGTNSSMIWILNTSGAWSKEYHNSGRIEWLSSSTEFSLRNIKLMTEFKSSLLSEYLVGTRLVEWENYKFKASATSKSISLWIKWKE